jgi:mevalonate kinase
LKKITFSVPAKVIISGEHAVIYGHPALVAAIEQRMFLELRLNNGAWEWRYKSGLSGILGKTTISGIGSSAQYAVLEAAALSWIINKKLDMEKISRIAHEIENLAHKTASGVDTTIVTYGGVIMFRKQKKNLRFKNLKFKKLPKFLLVDTGKPAETTGEMVYRVSSKLKRKTQNCFRQIGQLPEEIIRALSFSDLNYLSHLIKENQKLLEELGVVGDKAIRIIREIKEIGGAAKICGAGGIKTGSGIALVYHQDLEVIKKYCRQKKLDYFEVKLGGEGLKIESNSIIQ